MNRPSSRLIRSWIVSALVVVTAGISVSASVAPADAASSFQPVVCKTTHLTGKVTAGEDGSGAGSMYASIVLKNTGKHSCTLQGWAGVSLVGRGNGTQLGSPAKQNRDSQHARVTVKPGKTAEIPVKIGQAANYSHAKCDPVQADGFRVYPPASKTAIFVRAIGLTACASSAVRLLTVSGVTPSK